ncbi:MAG: fosfomycin resistance glutathione transferase [Gammaproteobacteria bacterium]|nr:fosfomycin resistance glutathione transferase [Gammaproteobacteria bacterium]
MISGLNHLTIAVSDLDRSLHFYTEVLGFQGHVKWDNGAYLSLGSLWFCLSCDEPCPKRDYTHIAFDIDASGFDTFSRRLKDLGVREWKSNKSEGQSLYILDPDGHKLEIHVGSLESRLQSLASEPYKGMTWL